MAFPSRKKNVKHKKSKTVHGALYPNDNGYAGGYASICMLTWVQYHKRYERTDEGITCKRCLETLKADEKAKESRRIKMKNIKYKKTNTVHRIRNALGGSHANDCNHGPYIDSYNHYDTLCGLACGDGSIPSFSSNRHELTNERVTCKTCLRLLKSKANATFGRDSKLTESKRKRLNVKMIKMFQTSDGRKFSSDDENGALEHGRNLKLKKSRPDFIKFVKTDIFFRDPRKEEAIMDDMIDNLDCDGHIGDLDDFSVLLWRLFSNYTEVIDKALQKFKAMEGG